MAGLRWCLWLASGEGDAPIAAEPSLERRIWQASRCAISIMTVDYGLENQPGPLPFADCMLAIIALFLAGVGLFFHGLSGLRQSCQGVASRRARRWLAKWARSPWLAGCGGVALGGLTQSVTAVAFMVASLVGGGLLSLGQALPIVVGANLGTALLVLVASFDVHLTVLLLLGLTGVAAALDLGGRARSVLGGLFFAALLFFGLRQMREALAPWPQTAGFAEVAAVARSSLLATFALGAVLRLLIQSSPAVAIVAITFWRAGVLGPEQAIAMMFGTGLGVGGAVFLLSSNLRGVPRQIALYQALLSMAASAAAGGLLAVERATDWPLLVHHLGALPGGETLRLAWAFVAMQVFAVALAVVGRRWAAPVLERLAPAPLEQELGRPAYIHDSGLADPESALELAAKEQQRLLGWVPRLLDAVRAETAGTAIPAASLHRAALSVGGELDEFLGEIGTRRFDAVTMKRWLTLRRRQELVVALGATVYEFAAAWERLGDCERMRRAWAEGLHALAAEVVDALERPAQADLALLLAMTADRGEMMENRRRGMLDAAPGLAPEAQLELIHFTALFERAVWLLRQLVQSLGSEESVHSAGAIESPSR